MNYAEDRLDRRARTSSTTTSPTNKATKNTPTPSPLQHDLNEAHCVIRRHAALNNGDERQSHELWEVVNAHRLAGKTLRDGGKNHQAVFHFGLAWRLCAYLCSINARDTSKENCISCNNECDEWETAGDYAQMAELAGFPEVGVVALLFYRAGSFGDVDLKQTFDSSNENNDQGCGCGMAECGRSRCYIAFPTDCIVNDICCAFDQLSHVCNNLSSEKSMPSALEILNQLALLSGKSSGYTKENRLLKMHQFMNSRGFPSIPPILQFWNEQPNTSRPLHPVLLLLLLKLLYSSPISGPFLRLACYSVQHLSALLSSSEGRHLATDYKSHWAYFVFIKALVLGERVKKKNGVVVHMPVWDVVFCRKESEEQSLSSNAAEEENSTTFSSYIQDLLLQLQKTETKSSLPLPPVKTFNLPYPPIYVLGDSHVLSLAWQSVCISPSTQPQVYRTFVTFPSTGIKAWHFRKNTNFFTHYNLHTTLSRLRPDSNQLNTSHTIILSAGEIDCREGIGGSLLSGYYQNCNDAIANTVLQYLDSVSAIATEYQLQILLMPVAPHAYRSDKNGKALGRAKRRETMHLWNDLLRKEVKDKTLKYSNVFLLDYEERLRLDDAKSTVGYVLDPMFNADYTHVNSAVVKLLVDSLRESGCDVKLL